MPQAGQKTITVSGKHLLELQKKYDLEREKHPGISFASFIAESALMELERRQLVREAAFISLIGIHDNMITLKDAKKNKFVEVQIKNQKLYHYQDVKSFYNNLQYCHGVAFYPDNDNIIVATGNRNY